MKQKIHLKRRYRFKIKGKSILLISICLVFLTVGFLLHFIGNVLNPSLMNYAEIETKRLAVDIINQTVSSRVTEVLEQGNLFEMSKNSEGEIQSIDFNSVMVNKVLQLTTRIVQEQLKALENGEVDKIEVPSTLKSTNLSKLKDGIVCEIPLGVLTGNSLLANIGPKFPVKLTFVGDVLSNVNTKINDYGINNAVVEISVHVEVTERIIMPFITQEVLISTDIPIAIKMIQGKIPVYYQNGVDKNSSLFRFPMQ